MIKQIAVFNFILAYPGNTDLRTGISKNQPAITTEPSKITKRFVVRSLFLSLISLPVFNLKEYKQLHCSQPNQAVHGKTSKHRLAVPVSFCQLINVVN